MARIKNIFWFIFIGFWMAILNVIIGIVLCVSIVFIPIGLQYLKLANVFALPFRVKFVTNFKQHVLQNVLYDVFFGFVNSVIFLILAGICCITIIGISFGKKCYSLTIISLCPVGLSVE